MKNRLVFLYPITAILIILTAVLFCVNMLKNAGIAKKQKEEIAKQEESEKDLIEYKSNQTIRVKFTKTGQVVAMDMNDYIRGVLPSEMPPSYNIEALKAQALVARTYTYKRMEDGAEGDECDICDDYKHCQAFYTKEKIFEIWKGRGFDEETRNKYWRKVNEAVVATQTQAIVYDGKYIKAFFHASSPDETENIDQIWGGEKLPYLVSVKSSESEEYLNRTSIVEEEFSSFIEKLKTNIKISEIFEEDVKKICINEITTSGRVKNILVGQNIISAEKLRVIYGLKSTKFTIEIKDKSIVFHVTGNGHGIGLSQVGADTLANQGQNYEQIIKHYYKGVDIKTFK
ncbi:MAG: stage II sporulation protein D [Clostridia bacterium]